ncbi:MAG: ribonuclease III [Candidatus Eisenbacteria bacterium]|uniref:Ribonuclease 3 n=1 Tax=Eiseniibacteriota bacterium TaxID=2212470 RepID=A0A9D6L7W3_UNCEI|nr:ribonuclease III [Candidatus Eisenbacteria bacterium]MBI3540356.1 ribonuclease III [Candidatus Eisenbacteria bacterium]
MADFAKQYGITFQDRGLLKLALTHRSYLHVTGQGPRESNERLEFLGDSVLGLVTSEFLYRSHPSEHEGQLTKTKSLLVSKAILSRRALAMGLGRFVFMSHSEVESGGRQRLSILADAFESVIGAIYLDQGFEAARAFIHRWLLKDSSDIAADKRHTNYKSHLQEYVQSTFRTHPVYRIRSEMGPDHSKQFMVEVMVGRRVLGEGRGRNKKEAEQAAARNALEAVENGPLSDRETRRSERGPRSGGEPARHEAPARGEPEARGEERPARGGAGTAEADDGGEESDEGRRRRRGRRGGRGRRERGDAPRGEVSVAPAGDAAPGPRERARTERGDAPAGGERTPRVAPESGETRESSRFTRPAAPPAASRMPEVEPPPRAADEDENEEVGRPEGPIGAAPAGEPMRWEPMRPSVSAPPAPQPRRERREAIEEPPARVAPIEDDEEPPAFEPFDAIEAPEPPVAEPNDAPDDATDREATSADEDAGPRYPEVEKPAPPPASPPPPAWGRRSRRGR